MARKTRRPADLVGFRHLPETTLAVSHHIVWYRAQMILVTSELIQLTNACGEGNWGFTPPTELPSGRKLPHWTDLDWGARRSFVDVCLTHTRNLIEFLDPQRARKLPDDVIADDFFDPPAKWHDYCCQLTPELKNLQEQISKQLAHVTTSGVPEAPPVERLQELWDVLQLFVRSASPARLSPAIRPLAFPSGE